MAAGRKAKTVALTELADLFGVDVRTIHNWRTEGMPSRSVSGAPRFSVPECFRWRREKDREEKQGDGDNGKTDKLRLLRAEADLKEAQLAKELGELVPAADFDAAIETFAGGLVAAVMGRLQQFERDIVQASTPASARAVVDRIQDEALRAAREYAQDLAVEPEPGEAAA